MLASLLAKQTKVTQVKDFFNSEGALSASAKRSVEKSAAVAQY